MPDRKERNERKNPNKNTFKLLATLTKYMSILGLLVLLVAINKGL